MKFVVAQLKTNILNDQYKSGHSNGQAKYVHNGGDPVPEKISEGNKNIVFKHGLRFWERSACFLYTKTNENLIYYNISNILPPTKTPISHEETWWVN